MKLIKPTFEILPQSKGLDGIYKQIEIAGRTCYRSEDKITGTSAKEFVERMIKSGHGAMLEHGTVYLKILHIDKCSCSLTKYENNKYSKYKSLYVDKDDVQGDITYYSDYYVTTNYRVLLENGWLDDLQYLCEPTEHHEKRTTVKFIMDRIGSQSFVRHRVFSFAQESTRYCNYSKDKFDNEITFIIPCWIDWEEQSFTSKWDESCTIRTDLSENEWFIDHLVSAECTYNWYIKNAGWTAQQARAVLPNSLKTELVMTGFDSDWEHFFKLRCDASAHPQARELSIPLHEEFIKLNKIK